MLHLLIRGITFILSQQGWRPRPSWKKSKTDSPRAMIAIIVYVTPSAVHLAQLGAS